MLLGSEVVDGVLVKSVVAVRGVPHVVLDAVTHLPLAALLIFLGGHDVDLFVSAEKCAFPTFDAGKIITVADISRALAPGPANP